MPNQAQFYMPKLSPLVKSLLILNTAIFVLQLILQTALGLDLSQTLGFVPARLADGWIWQPISYAFLHGGVFHILFNLLILWSIGSELETNWGSKVFAAYYFAGIVGAAITYAFFSLIGLGLPAGVPVIGSSGAVYALLLAYGILYGDRTLYFFMLFPMPARYFVMILGAVELISSVFYSKNGIAHTAHLGGMLSGFVFLAAMAQWRQRKKAEMSGELGRSARKKRLEKAHHLKLVSKGTPSEDDKDPSKPWH